jgi:hypothetical protein
MTPSVIFIVGLQKSGTTLMTRLLRETGLVGLPWNGEGNDFWGDVPPFSPAGHPTGTLYQQRNGERGHELDAADVSPELRELMLGRLRQLGEATTPYIANKNPYNVARVPWIRSLFPDARIVAMVRRPVANTYSLLKKHRLGADGYTPPADGWWGVKPAGWREHVQDHVIERCAWQWSAINRRLDAARGDLDAVVAYHELSRDPTPIVEGILRRRLHERLPSTHCFDDEYRTGSELRSKNRHYPKTKSLAVPEPDEIELGPLEADDVTLIERVCADTLASFPELE